MTEHRACALFGNSFAANPRRMPKPHAKAAAEKLQKPALTELALASSSWRAWVLAIAASKLFDSKVSNPEMSVSHFARALSFEPTESLLGTDAHDSSRI